MSDMPPITEELIVYGEAGGGGTDTIRIPYDFMAFYEPLGPTIGLPRPPTTVGGGGDVVDPKEELKDAEEKSVLIAGAFAVAAVLSEGTVAIVYGIYAAGTGVASWYLGEAANDPPQPNYRRPAGSNIDIRSMTVPGGQRVEAIASSITAVEHSVAIFVDAIECAQGAFLAGDAEWTQRHNESARQAYIDSGNKLIKMTENMRRATAGLPYGQAPPANSSTIWTDVLRQVRPTMDLRPRDLTRIDDTIGQTLRPVPTQGEFDAAIDTVAQVGRRLAQPQMISAAF